jgi:hypothetical protein
VTSGLTLTRRGDDDTAAPGDAAPPDPITEPQEARMSSKSRTAIVATAAVAAIAAATAIPALTGAQTSGARDITVHMKVGGGTEIHHAKRTKPDTLATGDALLVRLKMFSPSGAALGSAYTECVNVGPKAASFKAALQCTQTYNFREGQIVTAGIARFSQLQNLSIPIVGGSGAYRGASGHLSTGVRVEGYDNVDVLHLDG